MAIQGHSEIDLRDALSRGTTARIDRFEVRIGLSALFIVRQAGGFTGEPGPGWLPLLSGSPGELPYNGKGHPRRQAAAFLAR
jgi:hypothetical protein